MKRRIKKDNQRREVLNIPVAESDVVEVADSDTETKDADGKAATTTAKDEKAKEDGAAKPSERHSHRDDKSADRRRTPPRRRSPPRYRGSVSQFTIWLFCPLLGRIFPSQLV